MQYISENESYSLIYFLFTMEPITRAQLQNAAAEKKRIAHREQELKGQMAAEEFYKGVWRIAELGEVTQASSKSMELGVAFDTMLAWTKDHFPDCDVTMEIRHVGPNATYAIRVGWGKTDIIIQKEQVSNADTRWTSS
jgi:hypothetical protein